MRVLLPGSAGRGAKFEDGKLCYPLRLAALGYVVAEISRLKKHIFFRYF